MASKFPPKKELEICDLEGMDDKSLLEISLRTVSKILSDVLSQQRVIATYLRWLEVHRQQPSKLTAHWDSTLLHWTQALRARGCTEDQVVYEVNKWKESNEPLIPRDGRHPPTAQDIAKAYGKANSKVDSHEQNFSQFDGETPANYICNRCGEKGHHLQVCPTNMDPTYDRAPGHNYVCQICHRRGLHFDSLCPENIDPVSIIQKRKKSGIETCENTISKNLQDWGMGVEKRSDDRAIVWDDNEGQLNEANVTPDSSQSYSPSIDWTGPGASSPVWAGIDPRAEAIDRRQESGSSDMSLESSDSIDTAEIALIRNRADIGITQKRKHESPTPSRELNRAASPSPTKERRLRDKIRRIESVEARAARGDNLTPEHRNWIAGKAILQAQLEALDEGVGQMDRDYDTKKEHSISSRESQLIRGGTLEQNDLSKLSLQESQASASTQASGSPDEIDHIQEHEGRQIIKPVIKYSEFIEKLIRSRTEIRETVNSDIRATALGMWVADDRRRLEQMVFPKIYPTSLFDDDHKAVGQGADGMEPEDSYLISEWSDDESIEVDQGRPVIGNTGTPITHQVKENFKGFGEQAARRNRGSQ